MENNFSNTFSKEDNNDDSFESRDDKAEKKKEKKKSRIPLFSVETDASSATEKKTTESKPKLEAKKSKKAETLKSESHEVADSQHDTGETSPESNLSDDERVLIAADYVQTKGEEVDAEIQELESGTVEQAAASADEQFLSELAERIAGGEQVDGPLLDEIVESVVNSMSLEGTDETIDSDKTNDNESPEAPEFSVYGGSSERTLVDESDEPTMQNTPQASAAGGSGFPVSRAVPPVGLPVFMQPASNRQVGQIAPKPIAQNIEPAQRFEQNSIRQRSRGADMLAGGVIGYLFGRRRGRIKTEEKLLPVQKRLEKEITSLQEQISSREHIVRAKITEQAITKSATIEKRTAAKEKIKTLPQVITEHVEKIEQKPAVAAANRSPIQEKIFTGRTRVEQLGKLAIPSLEQAPTKTIEVTKTQLDDQQVMEIAKKVTFRGVSVSEMYRVGRLDRVTVRQVVESFVGGRSYERILHEQLRPVDSPEVMKNNQAPYAPATTTNHPYAQQDIVQIAPETQNLTEVSVYLEQIRETYERKAQQQKNAVMISTYVVVGMIIIVAFILLS